MSDFKNYISLNDNLKKDIDDMHNSYYFQYKNNKITKDEFIINFKRQVLKIYNSYISPSFQPIEAYNIPSSVDYNLMLENINQDLNSILNKYKNIDNFLNINIDFNEYSNTNYLNVSNNLISEIQSIKNNMNINSSYSNFFSESLSQDNGLIKKSISLPCKSSVNVLSDTKNINIKIKDSNGIPGDSHTCYKTLNGIKFNGESTLSCDLKSTLNNTKNHFEIELINVNDDVYNKCNQKGFDYVENIKWISNDKKLYLKLKYNITSSNKKCNYISLSPYIPSNSDFKECTLKYVTISNDKGQTKTFSLNKIFDKEIPILFDLQLVNTVEIYLEQNNSYDVLIGHQYAIENADNETMSIYDSIEDKVYNRIDIYKPTMSSVNMYYDSDEEKIQYQDTSLDIFEDFDNDKAIRNLYKDFNDLKLNNISSGIEIINGKRYMIGLQQISMKNITFDEEYTYMSKNFECIKNIKSITLYAEEYLPLSDSKTKIEYSISFDNGSSWFNIFPMSRKKDGPCTIKINDANELYNKENNVLYINRLLETKTVQLKIKLSGYEGNNSISPFVYNYRLEFESEV